MFLTVITDKDVTSSCNKLSIIDMPKRYNAFCEKKIYTYNLNMCLFKSLLNTRNYFLTHSHKSKSKPCNLIFI